MSTRARIILQTDQPKVIKGLAQGIKKVAKCDDDEKPKKKKKIESSGLKLSDISKPIVVRSRSTGMYFYKNAGEEFQIQGPFDSYDLAVSAALEELDRGPKRDASAEFPEFERELSIRLGKEENKKGPEAPEIHTTEMSEFGGPQQVKDQHKQAAEGDEFPGPDGENIKGPADPEIHSPESDREFPGPDGVNKQGPQSPEVHTTEMSEFGGPQEV